ncbi:hypothetical protein SBOR_2579 [Sclerotinia borealis F-4128]|uniref:Uncharacterized protein n=1 Tax=Sclerotinia borealis (strain F-4128) TaxID=1432307 RepID=W9CR01_SCLBF|nr:hypothetical protein SBOR_2579 [Sclerotinia borealis F-4128]
MKTLFCFERGMRKLGQTACVHGPLRLTLSPHHAPGELSSDFYLGDPTKSEIGVNSPGVHRIAVPSDLKFREYQSSMVGNSPTFAIGPKLLDDEEAPDKSNGDSKPNRTRNYSYGYLCSESDGEHTNPINSDGRTTELQKRKKEYQNETSTLPQSIARSEHTRAKKPKKG